MKQCKYLLTIILLLTSGVFFAQKIEKIKEDFQPENLKLKKTGISFRFWIDGQIIEAEQSADSFYTGRIINIAHEHAEYSSRRERKIKEGKSIPVAYCYVQKNELSQAMAVKVFEIINKHTLFDLPDCTSIPGWRLHFLDGTAYLTEQNLNGKYEQKSYTNPFQQPGIRDAEIFMAFYTDLIKELQLESSFNFFFSKLKVGCYKTQRGGYYVHCRKSRISTFFYRLFRKRHKKQENTQ